MIGAAIAIVGASVAAFVQYLFKRRTDFLALRREKLEEYVRSLNQLHGLSLKHTASDVLGRVHEMSATMAEILMLTNLYLPELSKSGLNFGEKSTAYMLAGRKFSETAQTDEDEQAFEASRQEAQNAWQFAIDQSTLLAQRLRLRRRFWPLPKIERKNPDGSHSI